MSILVPNKKKIRIVQTVKNASVKSIRIGSQYSMWYWLMSMCFFFIKCAAHKWWFYFFFLLFQFYEVNCIESIIYRETMTCNELNRWNEIWIANVVRWWRFVVCFFFFSSFVLLLVIANYTKNVIKLKNKMKMMVFTSILNKNKCEKKSEMKL